MTKQTPEQILTPIGGHTALAYRFAANGAPLHFYHANGFGAQAYLPFLQDIIPHFSVSALNMRPLWPDGPAPRRRIGWRQYGDDLIDWLDATQSEPVIGVGHSMGAAATAFAANKRPDLFRALVLIEPAGAKWLDSMVLRALPYDLRKRMKLIRAASRDRHTWPNAEAMFAQMRPDRAYRRFDDPTLRHLIAATTRKTDDGITLIFPINWETHNILTAPHTLPDLTRLSVPTQIIAAKPGFFCAPEIMARLQARRPDIGFSHFPNHGHLMPLESSSDTAKATLAALSALL